MDERISLIMPVLNEAAGIGAALQALQPLRRAGVELIVVDGGSNDGTLKCCAGLADQAMLGPRGRARQMNHGVARARGSVLLFLHADTRLPEAAPAAIFAALDGGHEGGGRRGSGGHDWGRFDVTIEGRSRWLRVVAAFMNRRSRWSGIATGDQAMFVRRRLFLDVGGFPDQPLMEDIELSRSLRRCGPPACLRERVVTSGRRWEAHGVWRTILLMWRLRLLYWLGVDAHKLAKAYR
jgi:rSAM/selenodomain-associated transferase 2